MISLALYIVATVLFVIAIFIGGVHLDEAPDLTALGLAFFSAAHVAWDSLPTRRA